MRVLTSLCLFTAGVYLVGIPHMDIAHICITMFGILLIIIGFIL
jgi:hypothetical protein